MSRRATTNKSLKTAVKQALSEMLADERELLREVLVEAIEEIGMKRAIEEGLKSGRATRDEVFRILRGKK
jgi:hypothetical protein